jgi:methyl-accepting chemotaxis protein
VDGINRSADIISEIAKSSDEQSTAIMQINTGIDQVAQVVQQNSANAEESAAAAQEINSQSDILARALAWFKTN